MMTFFAPVALALIMIFPWTHGRNFPLPMATSPAIGKLHQASAFASSPVAKNNPHVSNEYCRVLASKPFFAGNYLDDILIADRRYKCSLLARSLVSTQLFGSGSDDSDSDKENGNGGYFYDDFCEPIGDVSQTANEFLEGLAKVQQRQQQDSSEEDELPDFDDPEESVTKNNGKSMQTNRDDENLPSTAQEELIPIPLPKLPPNDDLTGSTVRQFSLGPDLILSDYAGSLGFDKVTDWQYFSTDPDSGERTPVAPRPMDPTQPTRTRSSSGSVVRVFRGEMAGLWRSRVRSRGLDSRVWLKEYSGDEALRLARAERKGLGRLQSRWLRNYLKDSGKQELLDLLARMENGEWIEVAQRRYVDGLTDTPTKEDDEHLASLLNLMLTRKAPFTALLGEMNLNDYYDDPEIDPNEWYKSLGVKPPQPGSVWLAFDYHGLSTAAAYAVPAVIQKSKLPPKRGPFGGIIEPPPLPAFKDRARYMVQGVLKGMVNAVASAHEAGIIHRSIGRNSFILTSIGQDKREAVSPYAVSVERLRVVLSDWGFSATLEEAVQEKEFAQRARLFDMPAATSYPGNKFPTDGMKNAAMEFAMAEDLHALGFVFLAMLFTTLAEPATLSAPMPPNDDDTWQRLFSEIFEKDMTEFRDYCANEDVWSSVVDLLDNEDGAGWDLLGDLLLARERVSQKWKDGKFGDPRESEGGDSSVTARQLLSKTFFTMK
mmetsp:Transcript_319/g.593  ORF Transcript_319/g.593 Transcript_319/m.593 type:complete len:713 (+) Transcript_319:52-2190(+)